MSGVRWVTSLREGRSVEKEDSSSRRRLTARPKHPDFRERASLRGEPPRRALARAWANEGLGRIGKRKNRFPAFFAPGSMTWGARSFRRRGAHALRFPGDGACQKQAAERSIARRPFTWRLRPVLLFEKYLAREYLGKLRHRSGRRARSCSTSPLSPLWKRAGLKNRRNPARKKSGKKKAAQSLARGSADDAARWHGSFETRTAGTPARGSSRFHSRRSRDEGEKPSVVPQGTSAMSEGGTAVRGVPVRQVSVAEVDE